MCYTPIVMRCFYHSQTEAVGVCKNCGKALCRESVVELGQFIACKESSECQGRARTASEMGGMSKSIMSILKMRMVIALVALGVLILLAIQFLAFRH